MTNSSDEAAVRTLLDQFIEGWNEGSGARLARPFAPDAEFINIMGLRVRGRDLIARGHDELFETVFFGTRLAGGVENVRFLRPDVAYADGVLMLQNSDGSPHNMIERALPAFIAVKKDGAWSIAIFRNMIPFERPPAGPLERSLGARKKG
jgi:uncharacterized protein (TIGR02246 family)